MCSSKAKPTCNRVPSLDRRNSLKKIRPISPPPPQPLISNLPATSAANGSRAKVSLTPSLSPSSKFPTPVKQGSDPNGFNISSEKVVIPRSNNRTLERKKKKFQRGYGEWNIFFLCRSVVVQLLVGFARRGSRKYCCGQEGTSGSQQAQRKKSHTTGDRNRPNSNHRSFLWITPSPPRKRRGVALSPPTQVGSDWTSILKKRQDFRDAFSGFDAETVAKFTEKQMSTTSTQYGIDISRVRGVADNSNRILEVKREFGSFEKYIWGFVNHNRSTQYKFDHKIPVKTSKSETISKDMVVEQSACASLKAQGSKLECKCKWGQEHVMSVAFENTLAQPVVDLLSSDPILIMDHLLPPLRGLSCN
ncbi:DNA glycosylase superfamily protein isoform 2 [Hibiscus syriacus]|uniref:DNA glycosylase superfamily protein isoform 2 n=1 Tax=Hibiscus syriacus TaxID=106335 RepID=A0A6A3CR54_HIBSY|nr:DNA glycosylase superfamily protein isoform 2 [Hibiscus syriacus]